MKITTETAEKSENPILNLNEAIINCRKCPRLVAWREQVARKRRKAYQDEVYWGRPVPGFGEIDGRVLVVGLAPAAHGANRTGRMFTGDSSGDFLYRALFKTGFANQSSSQHNGDGLSLSDLYVSAVCRCAPPGNKPQPEEILNCLPYLETEITYMRNLKVIVALGRIAFDGILRIMRHQAGEDFRASNMAFSHGAVYPLGNNLPWLVGSYHPSRQNTQTRRLTLEMFDQVWAKVRDLLGS
jgi:uracil-DNA glycosylase family 4